MATSTYEVSVLINTIGTDMPTESQESKAIVSKILEGRNAFEVIENALVSGDSHIVKIAQHGSKHTCRETALNFVSRTHRMVSSAFNGVGCYGVIVYEGELGKKLTGKKLKLIEEVGKLFFTPGICTRFRNGNVEIIYDAYGEAYNVSMVSLLLWIYRHDGIMEDILEHVKIRRNLDGRDLFEFLSVRFLSNSLYSDSSNPGIYLSLFSYYLTVKASYTPVPKLVSVNGCVNYARQFMPFSIIKSWVENVYAPATYGMSRRHHDDSSGAWAAIDFVHKMLVEKDEITEEISSRFLKRFTEKFKKKMEESTEVNPTPLIGRKSAEEYLNSHISSQTKVFQSYAKRLEKGG